MMAKPIRALELHSLIIQFLIMSDTLRPEIIQSNPVNPKTEGTVLRECLYSRGDLIKRVENERAFFPKQTVRNTRGGGDSAYEKRGDARRKF